MTSEIVCLVHTVKMRKKKIGYGMPAPGAVEAGKFKNIIIGGCLDGIYGEYGYECPSCTCNYYLDDQGALKKMFFDGEDEE